MKNVLAVATLFLFSAPCFSESCFDSSEYKNSALVAKAANTENAAQLGKAVDILMATKNLNFDQALKQVMRYSSPETAAYDKALSEVGEKIRPMKPQSPEECSEFIKLQRQYEAIGREKIQFVVSKFTEQAGTSNPAANTDATR